MIYDLIIRDALVIDGSDTPGVRADVAISDGRIQRIG
ncbi:N-acyl-D-amino acid deacylase family protein, partial [Pseudomonas amygdali pv. mori str. 301020]